MGEPERAGQTYLKLRELGCRRYVGSWNFALGAANCGRDDEALWLLRDAYAQRDPALLLLPLLPLFSAIETRPEFTEILRDIAA
jgi:hypothetical protein